MSNINYTNVYASTSFTFPVVHATTPSSEMNSAPASAARPSLGMTPEALLNALHARMVNPEAFDEPTASNDTRTVTIDKPLSH